MATTASGGSTAHSRTNGSGGLSFAGVDPYLLLTARGREVEIDVRRNVRGGLGRGFHRVDGDPIATARSLLPRVDSLVYSTRTAGTSGSRRWHEGTGVFAGLDLPFLGGAVGYFGYELDARAADRMAFALPDPVGLPDLSLAFVDRVLAYDHAAERLWILGLGFGHARSGTDEGPRATAIARSRRTADDLAARVEWILAEGPRVAGLRRPHRRSRARLHAPIDGRRRWLREGRRYGAPGDRRGERLSGEFLPAAQRRGGGGSLVALPRASPKKCGALRRLPHRR